MANDCLQFQSEMEKVAEATGVELSYKMKAVSESVNGEASQLKDDAGNQAWLKFDVSWDDVSVKFDLPEFKMVTQNWTLDLPQVTMINKEMIFHTPSTRMGTQKVGQYPEFHGLEIVWKDILIDVPEFFMQEQRIVVGIPEFKMDQTTITLDVPEVEMKTQEIIMGLPQFTLREAKVDIQVRADALKAKAEQQVAAVRAEVAGKAAIDFGKAANTLFSCLRTSLQNKKLETAALIEPAITMLQSSISKFQSIDSDESRQMVSELNGKLATTLEKKQLAEARFTEQIAALVTQEQQVVTDFAAKLRG